ncbi:hypothetical protein ACINNAV82_2759 [Acinetobacter baumannii Naval-82]|nr:hypothetical protein ACINNAV82_2759 [Acinetobacter baumannii Naval-82]
MLIHRINIFFLNGVCRHEPEWAIHVVQAAFLNGVCRHEQLPSF